LARFLGLSEDVKYINSLWILPVSEIHCSGYDNLNKIKFEESDNKSKLPPYFLMEEDFLKTFKIRKSILKIRRGLLTLTSIVGNTIYTLIMYGIWKKIIGIERFTRTSNNNLSWWLNNALEHIRSLHSCIFYAADVPEQSLKTWTSKNALHLRNRMFSVESNKDETLIIWREHTKYNINIYDILTNLEFTIKKNGSISTHRTKENVDKFMDKIQEVNWN